MGQRWSLLKCGYLEESEYEEGDSVSLSLEQSQASTEASSSVPVFDRGLCPACANDIEIDDDATVVAFLDRLLKFKIVLNNNLSNLQSGGALNVDTRKEEEACPLPATLSTSHFSSVKGSLKDSEIVQVSPSVAACRARPRKSTLEHKLEAYKEALRGQLAIKQLGASAGAIQPPPLVSLVPSPSPGVGKLTELAPNDVYEEAMLSPIVAKVGSEGTLQTVASQPQYSPAQLLLLFRLDRKRKRSSGLPSLAFDCSSFPATNVKLRARTPLERPSEGAVREAVLDLGTGDAMVGRSVKRVVLGRQEFCKGRVSCYNAAQRLYQVKYDDGKEEALEWLDLEPCLMAVSNHETDQNVAGGRGGSARTIPRYKSVNELYPKRKRPGKRVGGRDECTLQTHYDLVSLASVTCIQ